VSHGLHVEFVAMSGLQAGVWLCVAPHFNCGVLQVSDTVAISDLRTLVCDSVTDLSLPAKRGLFAPVSVYVYDYEACAECGRTMTDNQKNQKRFATDPGSRE